MSEDTPDYSGMTLPKTSKQQFPEGLSIHISMDEYYDCGIKDLNITIDKQVFVFTKQEIKDLLLKFKRGLPKY